MPGIQHVIAQAIHSVSLIPHVTMVSNLTSFEHRGERGRGMENNEGLADQKVQYI